MKPNLHMPERIVRSAIGVMLIGGGIVLVRGSAVLGVAMALVGGVLILSGWMGFCHVRKFLGELGSPKH